MIPFLRKLDIVGIKAAPTTTPGEPERYDLAGAYVWSFCGYSNDNMSEIRDMCYNLGIEKDNIRTIEKDAAWAYYHELKAKVEAQRRKTA